MVIRQYLKCNLCGTITVLRYQVGYNSFRILYPCGNCGCEIRGECIQDDKQATVSFTFDNACTVEDHNADFAVQFSRELLSRKVEPCSTDVLAEFSPFLSMYRYFLSQDGCNRLSSAMLFADERLSKINDMFDLVRLWENERLENLAVKINETAPKCPVAKVNHLQVGMRFHHLLLGYLDPLLPPNWLEQIDIFPLLGQLTGTHLEEIIRCADYFEIQGFLTASEKALFTIIKEFLNITPYILPAFALCDAPELKDTLAERGMFSISFKELKTYYQNSYEVIASCSDCLIALNGIHYRGDFSALPIQIGEIQTIFDLDKSRSQIKKIENFLTVDECFSKLIAEPLQSHVRNAIGHKAVFYDPITQLITFEDKHNGKAHCEQIYLAEFARMCIENFCTSVYLLEIIYQLRKLVFLKNGDAPDGNYMRVLASQHRKVGRNAPCPCGSGKKYKRCCMR